MTTQIVNYTKLVLHHGMFPQSAEAASRGVAQLADAMLGGGGGGAMGEPGATTPGLPPGFLEQFVTKFEEDGLDELLSPVFVELSRSLYNVSPLGDFHTALRALCELAALPAAAAAMTRHPAWLPRSHNGRAFENECLLGYAFL